MNKQMGFNQFTLQVHRLAKRQNKLYLCPGNNDLYRLWELGNTPEQVVENHCTVESQKKRFES